MATKPDFLKEDQIANDSDRLKAYGLDWTRQHTPDPLFILFPESTEDVQKIVLWARKESVSLVPSGGRTGLSGGAVAARKEAVVSFDRMNKIFNLNDVERTVRCQAGAVTENIQDFAQQAGFYFPIDFASRGSSQIGGNISTNAGGTKVIRYGLTRDWVLSLQVVTGSGELLELNQDLIKNNAGYDLKHLFIGSEGTLGLITEATLRLTESPKNLQVLLLSISQLEDSMEILKRFTKELDLTAFEFFTQKALQYVLETNSEASAPFPEPQGIYLLIEFDAKTEEAIDRALEVFERSQTDGLIKDGLLSQNSQQAETFWKYREGISEALSKHRPYKNDISVRTSLIPAFVKRAEDLFRKEFPETEIVWFGHIGDGNLHINVLPKSDANFAETCKRISERLFSLLQEFKGSISAEHGIGLLKKPYLRYSKSAEEIRLMVQLKKVFDPDGILNPGKIFDV